MTEKLKDYQVLDVFCGGTLYKVRHKVTNSIFAWKAYNCCAFSDEQIQNVDNEVKTLSKVLSGNFLRYYDTILHAPTKTLYFVLEYVSWQSIQELIALCKATDKHFTEDFIWYTLLELARTCKTVEGLNFVTLQKCLSPEAIFVGPNGELRVNCFELCAEASEATDLIQQIGEVIRTLCYLPGACDDKIKEFLYSDDLKDVISFLTDASTDNLRADVVIYHPTVLANTGTLSGPYRCSEILASTESKILTSEANKCDSEKAVEQCRTIEPLPRKHVTVDSPIYCNISPKLELNEYIEESNSPWQPVSPVIDALALELPGYVPRSRKPYSEALQRYKGPQKVSEDTLSHQWMSRLIALREREESLNRRERNLIAKEIVHSPAVEVVSIDDSTEQSIKINGITLPQVFNQESNNWVSRRRHRRTSSVRTRTRRKSYAYEELDSSLSADNGDSSMIITAAKITKENMPRRNIFPEVSSKKVHFTSSNPFAESDESVTLTFYELENVNSVNQVIKTEDKPLKDISKFKYLDLEKLTSEKRSAMQCSQSSPSKQAKITGKVFNDITNKNLRQTPSKTSLSSKGSRKSMICTSSHWGNDLRPGEDHCSEQTSSNGKLAYTQTPKAPPELKKSKRKSLLPFKTPFKFKTSTKV
ncbi:probable serine/threonine-protein kinase nek2 [Maniola hyperantus]|uniref:probable serine/threonine-protein kinase nek2 n=1 Tax=Aphantopus hyperantus TaxID=2795564 RepID=UPI001569ECB0|nr:probable serine/threonine-protein kinase nek2 [Maniola hyperantus]